MSGPAPMPAAEFDIDAELVRCLLREQHPDLAGEPAHLLANGWDNAIYRLGEDWSVRVPRRQLGADLIAHEQRWLPDLAHGLPVPIPAPIRSGAPGCGYPWPWSICPWIEGDIAATTDYDEVRVAGQLGEFLAALHVPAPTNAPENPYRGVPLVQRDHVTRDRFGQLQDLVPSVPLVAAWEGALARPAFDGEPVWIHGDLHPANIIVADGRVSGVVDWGDITAGDPATDLSVAWMLFDRASRDVFRSAAGSPDDDAWARARGWAVTLGLAYVASSADNPVIAAIGHRTLRAVAAEDG